MKEHKQPQYTLLQLDLDNTFYYYEKYFEFKFWQKFGRT